MSYLDRVAAFDCPDLSPYRPFIAAGIRVGLVVPEFADRLAGFPEVFLADGDALVLREGLDTPAKRTEAVEAVLRDLAAQGHVPDWRDEHYRVASRFDAPQIFTIERSAVPLMGLRAYGVHVNGIVRDGDGVRMWIGRRAPDRAIAPGKRDQLAAGGQPAHLTVAENLVKECGEEASVPPELAATARSAGAISYTTARPEGLRRDVLFTYDLVLPADFRPINSDGEIASFELLPLDDVAAIARDTDDFKFNCSLVVIDFLIRHGRLGPDDPDFESIVAGLRRHI